MAEIKPFEPDPVNTREGKSVFYIFYAVYPRMWDTGVYILFQGILPAVYSDKYIEQMITVNVNDTIHSIKASSNIEDLFSQLQISSLGVAVAINNQIVTRNEWSQRELINGENVLIIRATQGG